MTVWRGMSGTHWGVLAPGVALLIEQHVSSRTLNALAECATPEQMLDTLAREGFETLPGLGLIAVEGERVTAYLRGAFSLRVEASWHEAMTANGRGVKSWKEVAFEGVARFALFGPEHQERNEMPVRSLGDSMPRIVSGVQGLSYVIGDELTDGELSLITHTAPPEAPTTVAPTLEPAREVSDRFPDHAFADLFETTDSSELVAESSPPTENDSVDVLDDVTADDTRLVFGGDSTRGALVLPCGDTVPVAGTLLVGRNPQRRDELPGDPVPVLDPNGNISRTHARIFIDAGQVMIEDLGSTNGTVIVTGDSENLIPPHTPTLLRDQDQILLGGEVRLLFRDSV